MGFDALKFDVDETQAGFRNDRWNWHASPSEIDWMVERVAAVREAVGPSIDLAIDMHGRYDIASGIAVARAMEPFRLLWLEEPVPPENVAAMREVKRASPVPLCSGENLYLRWGFRDLLEQQAVDYIMPDIPKCGGLSECRKIANMAEVYYVPLAPHNVCGPLGTMASAHVCASIPNFLVHGVALDRLSRLGGTHDSRSAGDPKRSRRAHRQARNRPRGERRNSQDFRTARHAVLWRAALRNVALQQHFDRRGRPGMLNEGARPVIRLRGPATVAAEWPMPGVFRS